MTFFLNQPELAILFRQDPGTSANGGFQHLLVSMQYRVNRNTGRIILFDRDIERIHRYAFAYGHGGWEWRLKDIFGRLLGPDLGGNRPHTVQLTFDRITA